MGILVLIYLIDHYLVAYSDELAILNIFFLIPNTISMYPLVNSGIFLTIFVKY